MKKIFYITIMSSLLFSCGGGDNSTPEPANTAPTIPNLISPTNSKLCINNSVNFEWENSTDAEKNTITYQIQIASDNQFSQIVKSVETTTNYQTIDLEKGKALYWRVKAIDNKNLSSSYSTIYSFYTEGGAVSNHLPFSPQLVSPDNNSTLNTQTITLKWNATDVDVNDVLSYDLYFGINNPPTEKIGSALTTNFWSITSLSPSKIYYWKVVVKDNKGGETNGQIWSFKNN